MKRLVLLLALLATPAMADDVCEDLWFTRNLIMDRAGYCFGSALGQAVFDNSDCIGKSVSVGAADQRLVNEIRAQEKVLECRVNTGRTRLGLADIETRRKLVNLPVRDEFESSCIHWLLDRAPLYAGHDEGTPIVGRVEPGDNIMWSHISAVEGWDYVTITGPDWGAVKSAGWLPSPKDTSACRQWAG